VVQWITAWAGNGISLPRITCHALPSNLSVCLKRGVEYGSHAAAYKHGLRTPYANALALPSLSVFDPVRAGSNGFSDSFLANQRCWVSACHGPQSPALKCRLKTQVG
jgi:hypothetical protein